MSEETNALPTGYNLHRYQIRGVLGAGGFGITYRALHEALENEVAIKEYFPAEWAYRDHNGTAVRANAQGQVPARAGEPPCYEWGLQRFLDEAKILVQINHPGVVRVRDYFTANGSAYIVMEYEEGMSLSAALQQGGILPEQELHRLLNDVLPALETVHSQGYLHRDIKPSNLYLRSRDSHTMLIDFGAARQALGRRTRSVTSVVTPGYSPIEQYVTVGEDYGPWTDIYALGAVLYRCITGAPPVEAPGRVLKDPVQPAVEAGAGLYSRGLLEVVDQALAVRPEERYKTIAAMRDALSAVAAANKAADFSQVPVIKPELLELPTSNPVRRLELAPAGTELSAPSIQIDRAYNDAKPPDRSSQQTVDPFQRGAHAPPAKAPVSPADDHRAGIITLDALTPKSPATPTSSQPSTDSDLSLPMLENIWENLDADALKTTPPSSETTAKPKTPQDSSPTLLKRSAGSAVEHLKKAATVRRESNSVLLGAAEATPAASLPINRGEFSTPQQRDASSRSLAILPNPGPRVINWTRILLAVFIITGLSGASLLGYEYYQSLDEERQREAAAAQHRRAEEAARRAQEESQQREETLNDYIAQTRKAMTNKELELAQLYLDRAAAINPNHPTVTAARADLLAMQHPESVTKTRTDNTTGMELNWVEGSCFNMGSPVSERDHGNDESSHQVCVKGFWIGKTEVTNGQYRRFKPNHDSGNLQGRPLNGDTQPAVNLNWGDANAFAEWLSFEANKRFRLPTEAEWEYAARAGTSTRYYWGNDIDPRYANFSDRNDPTGAAISNLDDGQAITAPVGHYLPNTLGLHDMAGNVWEWTCSEYNPNYGRSEQQCSTRRSNESQRVVRGGAWNSGPGDLRSAKRLPQKPDQRNPTTGFRVIMEE
ncbi:MAG: hypothetical protein EKK71_01610 [Candidatus Competibacteraceae bacterium]|nr:MAG: hypothetical protein EKK71_01610 [Candidatus Competibacteraceae bacterium]